MTQKEIREYWKQKWNDNEFDSDHTINIDPEKVYDFFLFHHTKVLEEIEGAVGKEKENAVQFAPPKDCFRHRQKEPCESCAEMKGRMDGYKRALTTALEIIKKYK